ncbi:unnamed protein product [Rhizoctonia solani]|uniref:Uncharacterized protein n=1 Tax=Rhizoctonia solani TaxID=456999 RepID=A0A8H2WKI5_9AGAM|nr:unnamed protein product [Rhizoctonia solani]
MSAATSFSPPVARFSASGEYLSVNAKMDGAPVDQTLPSGEESIEVQQNIDARIDELSMDEDRAQIDELEEDPNDGLHYQFDLQVSKQSINDQPQSVQTDETADPAYGQNNATSSTPGQATAVVEPAEDTTQADLITDSLVSETDAILRAEANAAEPITSSAEFVSFEEQGDLEIPEEGYELPVSLSEQDISEISAMAQKLAAESSDVLTHFGERQSNEQDPNQAGLQTVESESVVAPEPLAESHEDTGAPPLHRMDEDTIPVTTHSKDSIVDALNDAPGTTADESIRLATTEEPVSQEHGTNTSAGVIPEQVDTEMSARDEDGQLQKSISASVMAHLEHVQVLEPSKEGEDGSVVMESNQVIVEQTGEPNVDTTSQASIGHQPVQIIQEPAPEPQAESTALDSIQSDIVADCGAVDGPMVTVIERSTAIAEETPIEQPRSEPPADSIPEVAKETTTISDATAVISTDLAVAESVISAIGPDDMEIDQIERATQVQREQDATVEAVRDEVQMQDGTVEVAHDEAQTQNGTQTQDGTQATPMVESVATANGTVFNDDSPDPTAPKDSDSPLRLGPSQLQLQSQSQTEPDTAQIAGPIDPLIAEQEEANIPEENSNPTKPQYQAATDPPTTTPGTELSGRRTPEWSSFGELDQEDAPGSLEPEGLSSEPSEYPDVLIEDSPLNPASASNDKAKKPSNSPTASIPERKKRPRMIMEVVIPIAPSKLKVVKEIEPTKRRPGRPAKKAKATDTPEFNQSEPSAVDTSSSPRRSSSGGTPSPVKSENSEQGLGRVPEPTPRMKKSGDKRPKPFGSRKPAKKTVASGSRASMRPAHVARASKVEVVMPRRPRPSVLRRAGSIASGNNVKFAPASSVTRKRKAESEPEAGEETDADADGETDDGYEDVEEPRLEVEVVISPPKSRKRTRVITSKAKTSPVKRPRRSKEARKTPTKFPETVSKGSRSTPKRRRLRR